MEGVEVSLPKRRYRLILDFKCQFPEKLYDVANDGHLIHWNRNGSVSTREEEFEANVMTWYPGFLQISSFLNFKRLFREYGFDRDINQNGELEWSHPNFVRGRRDLVKTIKTRRKSFRNPRHDPVGTPESLIIPTEKHRRYSARQRKRTQRFRSDEADTGGGGDRNVDITMGKAYIVKPPHMNSAKKEFGENTTGGEIIQTVTQQTKHSSGPQEETCTQHYRSDIMDNYAEKEFNEEEYRQWIAKKRKLTDEKMKLEREWKVTKEIEPKSNEFWWMYENKTGGEIIQTVNLTTKQTSGHQGETCTPCGFCKCCSAISNYVHLFGEVPENIQVIDYLEEVVQTNDSVKIVTETGENSQEASEPSEITVILPPNYYENDAGSSEVEVISINENTVNDIIDATFECKTVDVIASNSGPQLENTVHITNLDTEVTDLSDKYCKN